MSNTINVAIATPKVWTEAIAGATSGVVSIANGGQHCIHTGAPAATLIGHRFTGDLVPFTLLAGDSLYIRADTATNVVITED